MCLKSFKRPGLDFFPSAIHFSLHFPPFQFLVVKPNISTLTEHLSNVLDKISAHIAAIVIGLPKGLVPPTLKVGGPETAH